MQSILSDNQRRVLDCISSDARITDSFYLSGGTALAEYYLHHRLSEDLDFFSEQEVDPQGISIILKSMQTKLGTKQITFEQSFNRNLFFLNIDGDTIKTEANFAIELPHFFPGVPARKLFSANENGVHYARDIIH